MDLVINGLSDAPTIPAELQQVLSDQTISEDGPGTVLSDFATLLEFIGEDGLRTTSKNFLLPQSRISELNDRMSHPVPHRLKRPQQRSFPQLNGLYMILRASGLAKAVGAPPAGCLTIDPQILDAWRNLNPTEQYFTLLESWLVLSSPEIIGEGSGWSSQRFSHLNWVYQLLRKRRTGGDLLHGTMSQATVAIMELFGWVTLEYADPREGKGMNLAAIERLALGDAMACALGIFQLTNGWIYDDEQGVEPGILQPVFQPYFPEWRQILEQPQWLFREGTYTWRVSLGSAWRRIVATADMCLDDLAMSILDAFEFDADHLYCFQLRDAHGRNLRIACPYEEDAESLTDEVNLGDLPLPEGGVMTFVFDYGDNWQFAVLLEEVSPTVSKLKSPKVSAKDGRPPAQYDWGDEDE